ncbi:MAG: UMP kinase [Candidatus Caccosoma sp.]|nr:UMP kinase [Candidatus Caccosoma sp.]
MYKRVLLKLSGEALSNENDSFCQEHLDDVALEIKEAINEGVQICIVIGGGNIYRGKTGEKLGMDRSIGDFMGMIATMMNSLALSNSLNKINVDNIIYSSIELNGYLEQYNQRKVNDDLNNKKVVIFAGGTGHPYFSTDTCSALRALESKCDIILAAKNGVDGVYSADPKKDKTATRYDSITFEEVISKNLQVMDQTAISLCKENKMPIFVFNMNTKGNILKACEGKTLGTLIK